MASQRRGFALVLGVAVAVKLAMLIWLADKPPNVDGIRYLRAAQEMDAGHFSQALNIYPMPAYPALIVAIKHVTQDWLLAGHLLSSAGLLAAIWLLYRIAAQLFDYRAAFWGSLAFALTPFQNGMGMLVYRDPVYLCIFAWALLWMIEAVDEPQAWRVAAAAWVGCAAALFRIEGIILTPVFLIVAATIAALVPDVRRRLLAGIGMWLAMAAIVAGAFLLFDGIHHVGLSRFDQVWDKLSGPGLDGLLQNYTRIHEGLKAIEAASPIPSQELNFGEIARNWFWLIYILGLLQLFARVLGVVNLLPLFIGARAGMTRVRAFVWTVFAAYTVVLYVSLIQSDFSGGRFAFAAVFLLYPWVGEGLSRLVHWIQAGPRRAVLWLPFYGVFIIAPLVLTAGKFEIDDLSAVQAGRWFAQSSYRDVRIIGNDPLIAYEAGIPLYTASEQYFHFNPESRDFSGIEQTATKGGRSLIFLKLRKTRLDRMPTFSRFKEIKRFSDEEKLVFVFADPDAIRPAETAP